MERLSGLDASFFYVETPSCHMHVVGALVLDPSTAPGGYSFEKVVEGFEARLHLIPTFRKRVHMVPLGLDHPVWEDDPDFDLGEHFHHVACPAPGTRRELGKLVADIASHPLDRRRPLWEVWVIEGLEGGRVSVVTKVHHSIMDGVAGASVMAHLLDLAPDQPNPEPHEWHPESPVWDAGLFVRGLWRSSSRIGVREAPELASDVANSVWTAMRHALRPNDGPKPIGMFDAPRVPFSAAISPHRSIAFAEAAVDELKVVKRAFGTTLNDVVLGACAQSLRSYLDGHGGIPDVPLVTAIPVAVRGKEDADKTDNQISTMFVRLPVHIEDPVEQLHFIREDTKAAKTLHAEMGPDLLRTMVQYTPPRLVERGMRVYSDLKLADRHPPTMNLVISNVPGPPFPLYATGATVEAMYPMGPIMDGAGLNLTVLTYRDRIDFGALGCTELVPDIEEIADGFEAGVATLLARARAETPRPAEGDAAS